MAGPPRESDPGEHAGVAPGRDSPPRTPRWVKVSGIVVAILALLIVVAMLLSGGGHGPRRHSPSGAGGQAPLSSFTIDRTLSGAGVGAHTLRG
jgi:hypothetical protein